MKKFPRVSRYVIIMVSVNLLVYILTAAINAVAARMGTATISAMAKYVFPVIDVLTAVVLAAFHRRYVFRSTLAWGIAVPVMVALEILFAALTGRLFLPVMEAALAYAPARPMGQIVALASYAFNLTKFVLWAVLAYLFQRFVLYRESLDSIDADEKEHEL